MALKTLGTNATNTLNAYIQNSPQSFAAGDIATLRNSIKNDKINGNPIWPDAYTQSHGQNGSLYIPNRGVLIVLPGDYVGVDSQGWPILVSANSIANGPWTHS